MKALTIRQPWAALIAAGVKTIETRSWPTKHRGPLAIHAGKAKVPFCERCNGGGLIAPGNCCPECGGGGYIGIAAEVNHCPLGAVVATCTLADVVPIVRNGGVAVGVPAYVTECEHEGDLPWQQGGLWLLGARQTPAQGYDGKPTRIEDQRPFGDFTPDRYAWLLTDITPLAEPIPAKGRLGLWDWEAS